MNGRAFALTISLLLATRASLARQQALSGNGKASAVTATAGAASAAGVERTMFADLGDDLIEELERDLNQELDIMADELRTLEAASSSSSNGCSSSSRSSSSSSSSGNDDDDDDLPLTLSDQEFFKMLFEDLEPHSADRKDTAVAAVAAGVIPTTATAAVATKKSTASHVGCSSRSGSRGGGRKRQGNASHRTQRRRKPSRSQRSTSTISGGTSGRAHLHGNTGRHSTVVTTPPAAPQLRPYLNRAKTAGGSRPSSAKGSLGARRAAVSRAVAATTLKDKGSRGDAPSSGAGARALSTAAVVEQRVRHGGGGGGCPGAGRDYVGGSSRPASTGGVPRWNSAAPSPLSSSFSSSSPSSSFSLRRARDALIAAAIVAALSIALSGRWRPLVLLAVPLVRALMPWAGRVAPRLTSRARRKRLLGAVKVAVVLAFCAGGAFGLTMAITQPLMGR